MIYILSFASSVFSFTKNKENVQIHFYKVQVLRTLLSHKNVRKT